MYVETFPLLFPQNKPPPALILNCPAVSKYIVKLCFLRRQKSALFCMQQLRVFAHLGEEQERWMGRGVDAVLVPSGAKALVCMCVTAISFAQRVKLQKHCKDKKRSIEEGADGSFELLGE